MLLVRYRIGVLEDWLAGNELDLAIEERRAEGVDEGVAERVADGVGDGSTADPVGAV
jgi:hypothetical protein